jgi:hypothetical protein
MDELWRKGDLESKATSDAPRCVTAAIGQWPPVVVQSQ